MKLHPRSSLVRKAAAELAVFVAEWSARHELTVAETVQALLSSASDFQVYAIRDERKNDEQ